MPFSSSAVTHPVLKTSLNNSFQSSLAKLFKNEASTTIKTPKIPDVTIDSDYNLAILFGLVGLIIIALNPSKSCDLDGICPPSVAGSVLGGIPLLLASLFAVQAGRVRFLFDETAFELKYVTKTGDLEPMLVDSGENVVVGGANRWDYGTFVNWKFFPSVDTPILVYFKENQTPEEKWSEGPGGLDKKGGGQVHFFPVICNAKQLENQFKIRGCATLSDSNE